jgi:hypothetical protein
MNRPAERTQRFSPVERGMRRVAKDVEGIVALGEHALCAATDENRRSRMHNLIDDVMRDVDKLRFRRGEPGG